MSLESDLSQVKSRLEELKVRKIENETNIKNLEQEKSKLLKECERLGVDPKKIDDFILEKENSIKKDLEKITERLKNLNGNGNSRAF